MRDPNRIPTTIKKLEELWKRNPDYRLGQLIMVIARTGEHCPGLFHLEDDKLIEGIDNFPEGPLKQITYD